uniref:Uncharacterized protein n=2 Tax=Ixodes ricinus TaxID=34613 RepID=V5HFK8_IXORI
MHRDWRSAFLVGVTQLATVPRTQENETDIIRFSNADSCNQGAGVLTAEYKVLYSNYESCFVLMLLGTKEKRCELWVKEGFEDHSEDEPDKEDNNEEEDEVKGEEYTESRNQRVRKGGLGHCVQKYSENCGSKRYKIYEKDMSCLSSIMKETNATTTF